MSTEKPAPSEHTPKIREIPGESGTSQAAPAPAARLSKWMAQAGLCSRREAEVWIEEGRVTLDGSIVTHPAVVVDDPSRISVDGKPLKAPEAARLWKMHKPAGALVTESDPEGRPTIYDLLPKGLPRLLYVGRLDFNSEGLLLLTNNGELKRKLELPATGLARTYRVRLHGKPKASDLEQLAQGLEVDGIAYGPIQAEIERSMGANTWLQVTLHEGKNREIRRVFEHLGYDVNRLIRISYGPITLATMPVRSLREVNRQLLSRYFGFGPKRRSTWARAKTPDGKRIARPSRSEIIGQRELRDDVKEALEEVEKRDAAREEGRRRKAAGLPSLREERSRAFRERNERSRDERRGGGSRNERGGDRGDHRGGERRSFGERNERGGDRGNNRGGERRSFGERNERGGDRGDHRGGERRSFGERNERGGDRGNNRGGERRSFGERNERGGDRGNNRGGERRSFGERNERGGDRRSFGDRNERGGDRGNNRGGERRSFGERNERGGERRPRRDN